MNKLILILAFFSTISFANCDQNEKNQIKSLFTGNLKFNEEVDDCRFILLESYDFIPNAVISNEITLYNPSTSEWSQESHWGKFRLMNGIYREVHIKDKNNHEKNFSRDGKEIIFFTPDMKFKQRETNYKMNLKSGIETTWYKNGGKESEVEYKNNLVHGTEKKWDEFGVLISEKIYINGVLDSRNNKATEDNDDSTSDYFSRRKKELAKEKAKNEADRKNKSGEAIKAREAKEFQKKSQIIEAKNKCSDLGFTSNTDKHAKCVLELMK